MIYTSGAWEEENSYTLTSGLGDVFLEDGPYPQSGEVFEYMVHAIGDCDDTDPSLDPYDLDQDGATTCPGIAMIDWPVSILMMRMEMEKPLVQGTVTTPILRLVLPTLMEMVLGAVHRNATV